MDRGAAELRCDDLPPNGVRMALNSGRYEGGNRRRRTGGWEPPRRLSGRKSSGWGTLYAGDRRTTVKDRKREIGKGLFNKMLAGLGIDGDEFRGTE